MNITDKNLENLLVASITPYFIEKEFFWFTENLNKILESAKTQPFFKENILYLKKDEKYNFHEMLRKLDEMGYEKVFDVSDQGEFSIKGGVIDIFPINMPNATRIDFLGNKIENFINLDVKVESEEKAKNILQKKIKSQKLFSDLKNLKTGDYLVHLDHGVGKFIGKEKIKNEIKKPSDNLQELAEEYYVIEYAKEDKLFVPVGLERKLSKYVGFADPNIARLGSDIWHKLKRKIKEEVEKLAKELLALYSKKEIAARKPYIFDTATENRLIKSFIYQETPDQIKVMQDIKEDLQKEKPMDRIVCGDVGFGKTEIAIRSSLLAATNDYQTAVICPTTILAQQHYNNFKERFKELPINVGLISRLQTKKEQQEIIKKLKLGKIDILIGTHRVLSQDIEFKNIQLLIIDDEQRFGVKQKEKLRQKNPSLDILSLSATPIPRTLYLALSSFKVFSLMQTPPEGRTGIKTKIMPYSLAKIKEAINNELLRKGQVYFLHNKVGTIKETVDKLSKLFKKVKFSAIHGRMSEKEILKIMADFQEKKIDVLVATTIIENGIDLPNVNTIIVEDVSRLGLSQSYQIRGRVGRSHKEGYAYLFYPKKITGLAKERLRALGQAKELGSGYQIAMKDLEIRGAGNILGREQSGSINKVGLNLYCQMLAEAIEKSKNQ